MSQVGRAVNKGVCLSHSLSLSVHTISISPLFPWKYSGSESSLCKYQAVTGLEQKGGVDGGGQAISQGRKRRMMEEKCEEGKREMGVSLETVVIKSTTTREINLFFTGFLVLHTEYVY